MKTRSQTVKEMTQRPPYTVDIDFDEASESWKSNKKSQGNGTYTYKCRGFTAKGNTCNRKPLNDCDYCKLHRKMNRL